MRETVGGKERRRMLGGGLGVQEDTAVNIGRELQEAG